MHDPGTADSKIVTKKYQLQHLAVPSLCFVELCFLFVCFFLAIGPLSFMLLYFPRQKFGEPKNAPHIGKRLARGVLLTAQ